ncbi:MULTISPECIES: hypothetical protein [Arenibacter]|uniref:hypothetical protein n=1 Tax=Arenibacter TaxID=178469 RepID=UPI001C079BB3|nr:MULTISPECIES: hypothetical protein [Arenibacter]MBU2906368.1 hypothetical protein [Arenibacter algicola]MCK0136179.1 hypothetical protein [Arenibacter sp. S6351L]
MDKVISQYNSLAKSYLFKLTEYSNNIPNIRIPVNSTFKKVDDYLRFRSESLKELITLLQNLTNQLDKYGKFKTLDPKIIRMAEMNALTNGKFYDYAISHFNYVDIEPELFELIDSHFTKFCELSKKIESVNQ